jgi:hypothetical protein
MSFLNFKVGVVWKEISKKLDTSLIIQDPYFIDSSFTLSL